MILTIAQDFTDTVTLDSELTSLPDGGMYLNSGVHPSITVSNLLNYLPNVDFTFAAYAAGTTYGKYTDTRVSTDIVLDGGIIYQSLTAGNIGNTPASSPTNWLVTDIDSLRIKSFVLRSQDNAISKINLQRRLLDNQYLYNIVEVNENPETTLLPNDYAAWVFEPKGSDYTVFTINQMAFQALTATPQSLYVVNQGQLITTLTLNPNAAGRLEFEEINYTFSGKGKWFFVVDAQNVLTNGAVVDPLNFDGFVAYTAVGIGATAEDSEYTYGTGNNGLSFNISTHFDSSVYTNNNLVNFSEYLQSAWELDVLNMFLHNSNNRSNREQRMQLDKSMLIAETKELEAGSVIRKFEKNKKQAIKQLGKTLDRTINDNGFEVTYSSI
jgi:hypothetical protein